ncbi:hypothetical protein ACMFMF_011196 [Clarireedia jacksonii]
MMDPSKKYKPSLGFQQCFEAEMRKLVLMSNLLTSSSSSTSLCAPADDSDTEMKDVIQTPDPVHQIFVTTPPEIILEIYSYLNPIDTICFSLINKFTLNVYLEHLQSTNHPRPSLSLGSPSSPGPLPKQSGCRHCVPVLHYPAHCQLHYHLRSFMPRELNFCAGQCQKYTPSMGSADGVARECAYCGRDYRKGYERGRRRLNLTTEVGGDADADADAGEPRRRERVRKWYEQSQYERER